MVVGEPGSLVGELNWELQFREFSYLDDRELGETEEIMTLSLTMPVSLFEMVIF